MQSHCAISASVGGGMMWDGECVHVQCVYVQRGYFFLHDERFEINVG